MKCEITVDLRCFCCLDVGIDLEGGTFPFPSGLTCALCSPPAVLNGHFWAQDKDEQNMRVILLLCLLTLGNARLYQPFNITEFLKNNEIMMADSDDDDEDEDEDDEDDDDYDDDDNCPAGCHCFPKVLQCSDQGESRQCACIRTHPFKDVDHLLVLYKYHAEEGRRNDVFF